VGVAGVGGGGGVTCGTNVVVAGTEPTPALLRAIRLAENVPVLSGIVCTKDVAVPGKLVAGANAVPSGLLI